MMGDSQQSILWTAAFKGNEEMVQLAIVRGAEVDQVDASGATPLYAAAANRHLPVVELLLAESADPNIAREDRSTALHAASANCSADIVSVLLAAGASERVLNGDGRRPLELACVLHEEEEFEERLRVEGILAPLIEAAREGNRSEVEILLENEDPDLRVRSGKTSLMYAAKNGDSEILTLLLEAGGNPDFTDLSNWTALHYAVYAESPPSILALNGADSQLFNNDSLTPLMLAVSQADVSPETIDALLAIGSDPNIQSEDTGDTALHIASRLGSVEVVEALIAGGASPDIQTTNGESAREVIGESGDITEDQRTALLSLMSTRENRGVEVVDSREQTNQREIARNSDGVLIEAEDDDGDSFSTGDVIAFLLVPPAILFLCAAGFVLYHRDREEEEKKQESGKMDSFLKLFPQFGKQRTVMDVQPHIRHTERELPSSLVGRNNPNLVSVNLVATGQDSHVRLDLSSMSRDDTAESSGRRVIPARHGATPREVTTEITPIELAHPTGQEVEETPRLAPSPHMMEISDRSSEEFRDAKERFSTSGSLISSMKSDEFKDALEQPELSSASSGKDASEFHSAGEGGGSSSEQFGTPLSASPQPGQDVRRVAAVDSFALDSFETTESRPTSTESAPPTHARTGSSSEAPIEPVQQQPPEEPDRLQSFMVQAMSETTVSVESESLTNPSREVSMEMEAAQRQEEGGPLRVVATGRTTEDRPQELEAHQVPNFALESFGSMFSESSNPNRQETSSFSFHQSQKEAPSPEPHRISMMSSRTSTESYDQERSASPERQRESSTDGVPSVQGHRVAIMSSQSSIESSGQPRRTSEDPQRISSTIQPPSVQGHRVSIVSSEGSIESAGQQRTTSEDTQRHASTEQPPSVQGHRVSIASSRLSTESYEQEGQPLGGALPPASVEGHQISIFSTHSSIESFGQERGSSTDQS